MKLVFDPSVLLLQGLDDVLDTTALLRSCVQSAVGMLRDQVESGLRSTRRVEILLTLLSDNDNIIGTNIYFFHCKALRFFVAAFSLLLILSGEFLQIVKRHLHSLLEFYDGNTSIIKSNWVIKEASNIDALQEGGTFR